MNLLIPIASNSMFFKLEDYVYPKPLIEINGIPMIQHVIENLTFGNNFNKIIFIVKQDECDKYHLDDTLNLLSPSNTEIIKLRSHTKGALCSALLAIEHINNNETLIISNADQIFVKGISDELKTFVNSDSDAACLTFASVHPRWSYVRIDSQNNVVETAEKRAISKNAIAGLYMYKKGSDFIKYGMDSIKHGADIDGVYFISLVFNEFILSNRKVNHFRIDNESYHSFYSPKKIEEYEKRLSWRN